jgi:hypothetical protein
MKDPNKVITGYVTDMAAVEQHIADAVQRQLNTEALNQFPEARRTLQNLHETLQRHIQSLERVVDQKETGNFMENVKEAIGSVLGIAAGLYDKIRTDKVSRMVRDTYTATNLATISYQMLHTTALGLKDQRVADLALDNMKDLTPILVELSQVVCTVVAKELASENKVFDGTVGDKAISNTQEAWSRTNVGTGSMTGAGSMSGAGTITS